ncbi:MAG: outer membrane lipoprotein chaperone LolA [Magnetococcus sp. DMHC-6]
MKYFGFGREVWVYFGLVLWMIALPVHGDSAAKEVTSPVVSPSDPVVRRLQSFLDRLQSVEADFFQKVISANGAQDQVSQGRFAAAKPGRFLWDYQTPDVQQILSDGKSVWYYEPELQQVTQIPADTSHDSPAAFLVSQSRIESLFKWEVFQDPQWNLPSVRLWPHKKGSFQEVDVTLDATGNTLLALNVEDTLGHRSQFTFSALRMNQPIPAEKFIFKVPEGVDVIDGAGWSEVK